MIKIVSVVGARPNFMKIAPFIRALQRLPADGDGAVSHLLVHTGQHYDEGMSQAFFDQLEIPAPDINLGVGSGSHAEQVGLTMIEFEKELRRHRPDWVVVVGDVNATLACSVTAKKEGVRCCHIEAGLRSRDMTMPEEVNRIVTDRLCDLLFTPDRLATENLRAEGVPEERIRFVGNIMIDTLEASRAKAGRLDLAGIVRDNALAGAAVTLEPEEYALVTLHRPSNVDLREEFTAIVSFLQSEVASDWPVIWPVHPRAEKQLKAFGLWQELLGGKNIHLCRPLGYLETLRLNMEASLVLTDSGGLQEECTVLGTPCLTLRWNTERPVTLRENGGASVLVGNDPARMRLAYRDSRSWKRRPARPELWDGRTAERIVETFIKRAAG